MLASIIITAMITAAGSSPIAGRLPAMQLALKAVNFLVMGAFSSLLFAAVYRVLPDRDFTWHDVAMGGAITAMLFPFGQIAIGYSMGASRTVLVSGAARGLMALLLWIYHSAEIFLFDAALTKAYAERPITGR